MPAAVTVTDERVAVTGGVEIAVRVHRPAAPDAGADGEAPQRILAVHGLASNARLWDGMAELLAAAGHTVAAVDQRGHGRSDRPGDGYDFATLTADLVAVLDTLGWGPGPAGELPVVAGQSWGGNVVVELAARHPGRVGALVLVDGGTIELSGRFADWPTCRVALTPPPIAGTRWEDFERMLRAAHPDWPETGIAGTLANMERRPDGTIAPRLRLEHHLTILEHLWAHHPSQRWPVLELPVLVLAAGDPSGGARFDTAKREEVARAGRDLPRGRVEWIDGDHDLHAQHPDRVAALVLDTAATTTGGPRPTLEAS